MRSTLYDTVTTVIRVSYATKSSADVAAKINLRKDGLQPSHHRSLVRGLPLSMPRGNCPIIRPRHLLDRQFFVYPMKEDPSPDGARIIRENSPRTAIATFASGYRTVQRSRPSLTAIGRPTISAWPTRSTPGITIFHSASEGNSQLRHGAAEFSRRNDLALARLRPAKHLPNVRNRPSRKIQPSSASPSPTANSSVAQPAILRPRCSQIPIEIGISTQSLQRRPI